MPKRIRCSYQLHIQLCETKPPIWRRIVVADQTTFAHLHLAIQAVMGWQNRHPYAFELAGQRYGLPNPDQPDDPTMDARRYTIGQLLQGKSLAIRYLYDFGDGWLHRIKIEATAPIGSPAALSSLPICLGGRNACPPEDFGGSQAYNQCLQAFEDPTHREHLAASRKLPQGFNAQHFDLQVAQNKIRALQLYRELIATQASSSDIAERDTA